MQIEASHQHPPGRPNHQHTQAHFYAPVLHKRIFLLYNNPVKIDNHKGAILPKITDQQRDARREQILAATWQCFYRRGIHATSMEQIIREAGLSAGAVYLYFKSKEELILNAIQAQMADVQEMVTPLLEADQAADPTEFIHEITASVAGLTSRMGIDLNSVILMCWSEAQTNPKVKSLIRNYQKGYRKSLSKLVERWQKKGLIEPKADPDDVAKALLSLLLGFIAQSALIGDVKPRSVARGMTSLMAYTRSK
jgi:TetR/AcrR family transcriptional regulator, transcriptional repressor of aconitase